MYEGILRWGAQEGIAIDIIPGSAIDGDTLRYPIGNKQAVDYYVAHFRGIFKLLMLGFYGIRHKLVSDSASAVPLPVNTLYPAQVTQQYLQQHFGGNGGLQMQGQPGTQIPIAIKPSQ